MTLTEHLSVLREGLPHVRDRLRAVAGGETQLPDGREVRGRPLMRLDEQKAVHRERLPEHRVRPGEVALEPHDDAEVAEAFRHVRVAFAEYPAIERERLAH